MRESRCLIINSCVEESIMKPAKDNCDFKNNLFVIVDTNVFLSDMKCMKELIKSHGKCFF